MFQQSSEYAIVHYLRIQVVSNTLPRFFPLLYLCGGVALFNYVLPPRIPPWGFLPLAGKSKPIYLPWWIGESVIGVYLRELWARTYPGLVSPGLRNPCLLILAWSLCNQLSLEALVLDSLSSAQSLILDVLILLLCNGPQVIKCCWYQCAGQEPEWLSYRLLEINLCLLISLLIYLNNYIVLLFPPMHSVKYATFTNLDISPESKNVKDRGHRLGN